VSGPTNPWADPATPTEPGAPYQGPPPTAPAYGYPPPQGYPAPYGYPPPYGPPGYGPPPWAPPRAPQRPGQVITSAVLAFVQALLVLVASLYLWFFASIFDVAIEQSRGAYTSATAEALASEGVALAGVQLLSAVLLAVAGGVALTRRSRRTWVLLLGAHAVQVVLAVYWVVRVTGVGGEGVAVFALLFAAAPLVGLGMIAAGPGRRWFDGASQG
jgi:hypothetical protein